MPWKELSMEEPGRGFVLACREKERSLGAVCADFGISRKTGYKWLKRFREGGVRALGDESRRPHYCPKAYRDVWLERLRRMRKARRSQLIGSLYPQDLAGMRPASIAREPLNQRTPALPPQLIDTHTSAGLNNGGSAVQLLASCSIPALTHAGQKCHPCHWSKMLPMSLVCPRRTPSPS